MKNSYIIKLLFIFLMFFIISESKAQSTLMHFWYFDANIPNNTPLTELNATYSITGNNGARIEYQSALTGYPFTSDHASWRKASLERRNVPTAINYRPLANLGNPYSESLMRGIQVKQPFSGDAGENTLILHVPTTGYENIVLMFAAFDEGAAEALAIQYSTAASPNWINSGIQPAYPLTNTYGLFTINFSSIAEANNNANFKIRIRFQGSNMGAETDGRVNFNNISIDGAPLAGTNQPPRIINPISLHALIEGSASVIDLNTVFTDPDADPMTFTAESDRNEFVTVQVSNGILNFNPLKRGDATITITATDGKHALISHSFRVLVYPSAFNLNQDNFAFEAWDSNQPEYSYPDNMIFLQSNLRDPNLETDLLYPYFIPHDDYHADDLAIAGFPYNTTGRTRINGLGNDGIAFINTGRERDLGGALLAVNTRDLTSSNINFTTATLAQNQRIYAIRLQYRIGTTGEFLNVLSNDLPVQYVASPDGNVRVFQNITLPQQALGQEYVQLLWRYFHFSGEAGARSQLRLDDIIISRTVNVDEIDKPAFKVFAAESKIFIESPYDANIKIEIYNVSGQKVRSQELNGMGLQSIDFGLIPGAYIVTLQTTHHNLSKKLIIH
jgi:hypothetical protein